MTKFELFKAMFRSSEWNIKPTSTRVPGVDRITHKKTGLYYYNGCKGEQIRDKNHKVIYDFGLSLNFFFLGWPAVWLEYRLRKQGVES